MLDTIDIMLVEKLVEDSKLQGVIDAWNRIIKDISSKKLTNKYNIYKDACDRIITVLDSDNSVESKITQINIIIGQNNTITQTELTKPCPFCEKGMWSGGGIGGIHICGYCKGTGKVPIQIERKGKIVAVDSTKKTVTIELESCAGLILCNEVEIK
jgi:hypothetical protein